MRQRVDGHKFEKEFDDKMSDLFYVLRLHTLGGGYSGLTQPADFLVCGNNTSFVETKETSKDSFSISDMEQLDEMKQFLDRKRNAKCPALRTMEYLIVVHFISHKLIRVITAEQAEELLFHKKRLHYDMNIGISYNNLQELKEGNIL